MDHKHQIPLFLNILCKYFLLHSINIGEERFHFLSTYRATHTRRAPPDDPVVMKNVNLLHLTYSFLHRHGTAAPPHATYLLRLILFAGAVLYAAAQPGPEASQGKYVLHSTFNPTLVIFIVVFICAFFLMGFFSLYLRQCTVGRTSIMSGGDGAPTRHLAGKGSGLQRAEIEAFPTFLYSAVRDLKIGGGGVLECAVCLSEFGEDETLRLLPKCEHAFHADCIGAWLASHTTCPVCRSDLSSTTASGSAGDSPETRESSDSSIVRNLRSGLRCDDSEPQISIRIRENNRPGAMEEDHQNQIAPEHNVRRSEMKFPRSHTTGHSLSRLGRDETPAAEYWERYTLRLPEEVRKQIMAYEKLPRVSSSSDWVSPIQGNQQWSQSVKNESDRPVERYNVWALSMTPLFISRLGVGSSRPLKETGNVS